MISTQCVQTKFLFAALLLVLASLISAIGCDSSQSNSTKTIAVRGQVLLDNEPLSGARVTFVPISAIDDLPLDIQPMSYGVTDADGNFTLRQADGTEGAGEGQHVVMISKPLDAKAGQLSLDSTANAVPEFYQQYGYLKRHVMPMAGGQPVNFKLSTIDPLLKE